MHSLGRAWSFNRQRSDLVSVASVNRCTCIPPGHPVPVALPVADRSQTTARCGAAGPPLASRMSALLELCIRPVLLVRPLRSGASNYFATVQTDASDSCPGFEVRCERGVSRSFRTAFPWKQPPISCHSPLFCAQVVFPPLVSAQQIPPGTVLLRRARTGSGIRLFLRCGRERNSPWAMPKPESACLARAPA